MPCSRRRGWAPRCASTAQRAASERDLVIGLCPSRGFVVALAPATVNRVRPTLRWSIGGCDEPSIRRSNETGEAVSSDARNLLQIGKTTRRSSRSVVIPRTQRVPAGATRSRVHPLDSRSRPGQRYGTPSRTATTPPRPDRRTYGQRGCAVPRRTTSRSSMAGSKGSTWWPSCCNKGDVTSITEDPTFLGGLIHVQPVRPPLRAGRDGRRGDGHQRRRGRVRRTRARSSSTRSPTSTTRRA